MATVGPLLLWTEKQACVKSKNSHAAAFYKEVKMKKIKTIEAIEAARLIKEMCSKRKRCKGCIFHDTETVSPCKLTIFPDIWKVD